MENLNAERITNPNNELYDYVKRIIEAVKYKGEGDHEDVPSILRKFAKGYEQRIKGLTEENERLIADNNRLIKEAVFSPMERANNTLEVRADTVREMQERLKAYFGTYVLGYKIPLTEALKAVNQIAKEMLEGE